MAVSSVSSSSFSSSSKNSTFTDGVRYALSQLGKPDLKLKDEQQQAIASMYSGQDVFVFLPTGFGKSICFQVLPFLFDHKLGLAGSQKRSCIIVVSPLVALMVDQVRSLRGNGIEAVVISSGSRDSRVIDREFLATEKNMGSASFIFSSPEALLHTKWREAVEDPLVSNRVRAVVVDEAHCVSKW